MDPDIEWVANPTTECKCMTCTNPEASAYVVKLLDALIGSEKVGRNLRRIPEVYRRVMAKVPSYKPDKSTFRKYLYRCQCERTNILVSRGWPRGDSYPDD